MDFDLVEEMAEAACWGVYGGLFVMMWGWGGGGWGGVLWICACGGGVEYYPGFERTVINQ